MQTSGIGSLALLASAEDGIRDVSRAGTGSWSRDRSWGLDLGSSAGFGYDGGDRGRGRGSGGESSAGDGAERVQGV